MSKQLFRVVETVVCPGCDPVTKTLKSNLTEGKAKAERSRLEGKQESFDPNRLVSYLIQPIN